MSNTQTLRWHLTGHPGMARHRRRWVITGPDSIVRPGATVTVERRDGTVQTVTVATTGRPFTKNGTVTVYGYPVKNDDRETCDACGTAGPTTHQTDENGRDGQACSRCAAGVIVGAVSF